MAPLLFALLLGGAPPQTFRWDLPRVISTIEVPALLETNGIPNRFQFVVSELPLEQVYAHFLRAFEAAGFHIPGPAFQMQLDGQLMLTAFDPVSETSYSVILQPYPNHHTGVIVAEAWFAGRKLPSSRSFAPVFPGAKQLVTSNLEGAASMSYRVDAGAEEVLGFYSDTLNASGYSRSEDGVFSRDGEALRVFIRSARDGVGSEVTVLRMRQLPLAP